MIELAGLSPSKQFKADVWAMGALLLCLCLGRPLNHRDDCVHLATDLRKKLQARVMLILLLVVLIHL